MYRLHSFAQSGNSYKVALALCCMQQPWDPVFIDFFSGATRSQSWRDEFNEMGEAPILEDGTLRLTQSGVILQHLANKHGRFAGRSDFERREVLRWILYDNHKFTSYLATYRFLKSFGPSTPDATIMTWLRGRIDQAFAPVERRLASLAYIVGDLPTIADFSLGGYLFYPEDETSLGLIDRHPNIAKWLLRMKALPGWVDPYDVLPGPRIAPRW